jgi:hypothetical protein
MRFPVTMQFVRGKNTQTLYVRGWMSLGPDDEVFQDTFCYFETID